MDLWRKARSPCGWAPGSALGSRVAGFHRISKRVEHGGGVSLAKKRCRFSRRFATRSDGGGALVWCKTGARHATHPLRASGVPRGRRARWVWNWRCGPHMVKKGQGCRYIPGLQSDPRGWQRSPRGLVKRVTSGAASSARRPGPPARPAKPTERIPMSRSCRRSRKRTDCGRAG